MALSDLLVRLRADTTDFSRKWAEVQRDLNKAASGAVASTSGFRAFGDVLTRAGTAATFGLTLPLTAAAGAALKAAGETERATVAFTRFTGSAANAAKFIKQIQDVADKSDLTFGDLLQGSRRIATFAKDATDATRTVRILTDAVAGTAGTGENFDSIARALQQIAARGKLSAEELNQMADAGVNVGAGLASALGVTQAQLQKLTSQGLVPADVAIQGILKALEKDFAGAAAAQSGTLLGLFSTVRDQATRTAQVVGEVLTPIAKRVLTEFVTPTLDGIKQVAKGFAELPPVAQNVALGLTAVVAAAGPVIYVLGTLAQSAAALGSVLRLLPFAALLGSLGSITTFITGSMLPAFSAVPVVATAISVGIAGIALAATAAVAAIGLMVVRFYEMKVAEADAAKASSDATAAIVKTKQAISARGGSTNELDKQLKAGTITNQQYEKSLRDMLVSLTNQQGTMDKVSKSTKSGSDALAGWLKNANATTASALPEWLTRVAAATEAAIASIQRFSPAFANMVREESFRRYEQAFQKSREAIADFVLAGTEVGKKLTLDSDFVRFAGGASAFGAALDSLTPSLDNVNARMIRLLDPANANNLPSRGSLSQNLLQGLTGPIEQARIEQAGLRAEADRLGEIYTSVAAAAGGSSIIAQRAYRNWVDAEKKAGEVTESGGQRSTGALREVSTILTNLNQRIAESIVNWKGFGDSVVAIAKQIGQALVAEVIGKLILTESRMTAISNALGKVLAKIPGLGKVFGGGQIPRPGNIPGTVPGGGGAAGQVGGAAAAAASAGLQATLGAVFSGVSAVTGIIGNVLAFKTGKDTARLEVTARSIFAEVGNIRTDNWTQHNGGAAFIPGMAEAINRFGDAHGRYLSEILATLQGISRGGGLAAAGGGGGGITINIQGNVIGTTPQSIADEVARVLQRR